MKARMTAREAKRYVLGRLAEEIRHHEANGSDWLLLDEESVDGLTERRVLAALREVADELDLRARRLR